MNHPSVSEDESLPSVTKRYHADAWRQSYLFRLFTVFHDSVLGGSWGLGIDHLPSSKCKQNGSENGVTVLKYFLVCQMDQK